MSIAIDPSAAELPIDSPRRRRLPILLRRSWYGLNQAFRRRIAHTGMTPDQFTVLRTLIESDPAGLVQSKLTKLMASDPNTIASLLERMEACGWIERKTHESDRRAYRIRIKPAGKRKFQEVREIAVAIQTEILAVLEEERRDLFLRDLEKIAEACQSALEKSPTSQKANPRPPV
jgi:DNA-binding MarR family transcriptional regulator